MMFMGLKIYFDPGRKNLSEFSFSLNKYSVLFQRISSYLYFYTWHLLRLSNCGQLMVVIVSPCHQFKKSSFFFF